MVIKIFLFNLSVKYFCIKFYFCLILVISNYFRNLIRFDLINFKEFLENSVLLSTGKNTKIEHSRIFSNFHSSNREILWAYGIFFRVGENFSHKERATPVSWPTNC